VYSLSKKDRLSLHKIPLLSVWRHSGGYLDYSINLGFVSRCSCRSKRPIQATCGPMTSFMMPVGMGRRSWSCQWSMSLRANVWRSRWRRRCRRHTSLWVLARLFALHGAPAYLRSDNGPEFVAHQIQTWLAVHHAETLYIDPGCPWQNGFWGKLQWLLTGRMSEYVGICLRGRGPYSAGALSPAV
jgi:hypothetical protein